MEEKQVDCKSMINITSPRKATTAIATLSALD